MSSLPPAIIHILDGLAAIIITSPIKSAVFLIASYYLVKIINSLIIEPWMSPIHQLPGPPKIGAVFDLSHLEDVME
jgi:hypothetical protein